MKKLFTLDMPFLHCFLGRGSYLLPHLSYIINVSPMCTSVFVFCSLLLFHKHSNIFNNMYSTSTESWLVPDTILSSGIQWKASLEFISWRGEVQKNGYLSHFSTSSFFYLMILGRIPSKATGKDLSEGFLNEISKYKDGCKELNLQNYFKMTQPISP